MAVDLDYTSGNVGVATAATLLSKAGPRRLDCTGRFVAGKDYPDPSQVWIMDGGMGSEIQFQNPDSIIGEAWSGMAQLRDAPLVEAIHLEYMEAGADIIIANSYASNAHVLGDEASGEAEVKECNSAACVLAHNAIASHQKKGSPANQRRSWVAGSISTHPPLSLGKIESDEYKDDHDSYNLTKVAGWPAPEEELANYRLQARMLRDGNVDFIALEMMKDVEHATRCCRAAVDAGLPIFLGITIKIEDGIVKLRDDDKDFEESLTELIDACEGHVVAVNIMHTPVDEILPAIPALKNVWDGPVGIYPNNARSAARLAYDVEDGYADHEFASEALKWAQTGCVSYIGGCCGFRPSHIAAARNLLAKEGFL